MRDITRIDTFLEEMKVIWKKYFPDWRFGQLMSNFISGSMVNGKGDFFYWEEAKFLQLLHEYLEDGNSPFYTSNKSKKVN